LRNASPATTDSMLGRGPLATAALMVVGNVLACAPPQPRSAAASTCPAVTLPRQVELGAPCGARCGSDRWSVKTLSDPVAHRVNLTPVETTVEVLAALPRPQTRPQDGRVAPVGTTVYCVEGWVADIPRPQAWC